MNALQPVLAAPSGTQAHTRSPQSDYVRPELLVPVCAAPPKIDGLLDDSCWKSAAKVDKFYRLTSPVTQQTQVWVCADSKRLYIAFHCIDSQPSLIRSEETQRDENTFADDYVQVDIDSEGTAVGTSAFAVTERGIQNESFEGGTADNITWAGDWHAATKRTSDGWDAEMSIPFALLRYPRNVHQFGVQFERKLARETSSSYWPDRPARSQIRPIPYYGLLTGISPTFYKTPPIFLPYSLLTAGQGNSAKFGLDVKYPLSTGLTAVATLNPDFATVEQSVASIAFSYAAQTISDERPFFAEGSNFFPSGTVLYTPDIANIDEGVKVTGKEGETSIGALATNTGGQDYQRTSVLNYSRDLTPLDSYDIEYAGNDQAGEPGGNVLSTSMRWGKFVGRDIVQAFANHFASWQGGQPAGGEDQYILQYAGHSGHPRFRWGYTSVQPNFVSEIGYVPFTNYHGSTYSVVQRNTFDTGKLQYYIWHVSWVDQTNITGGGLFQDQASASLYAIGRSGAGMYLGWSQGRHIDFRDHVNEADLEWSDNSSTGSGSIDYSWGTQSDDRYRLVDISQNYGLSRKLILNLDAEWQDLGTTVTSQIIFTPTYKLTSERSIGGRLLAQNNRIDLYFVYSQKARAGSDIYLIFGNPNSATTQGLIQLKIVTPF